MILLKVNNPTIKDNKGKEEEESPNKEPKQRTQRHDYKNE
jgi:hypothetical protein